MTLDELLENLNTLHPSAKSAFVTVRNGYVDDLEILSVKYEGGEVIIECEGN